MKKLFGVAFGGLAILLLALWAIRAAQERKAQSGGAEGVESPGSSASRPPAAVPTAATESDSATCERIASLCSTSDEKVDVAECERKLADGRRLSGAGNVERSVTCVVDAKTCAAATGCLAGGLGVGAVGEFLKGLGSSLSK